MATPSTNWMQQIYDSIKWRSLRQVCLPFSHDSGMVAFFVDTSMAGLIPVGNVATQTLDIGGQLDAGARFFDIRPCLALDKGSAYYTSHGQNTDGQWLGGLGQGLSSICDQLNNFTSQYAELVILEVSHCIAGYFGPSQMSRMTQSQFNGLLQYLSTNVHKLYVCPDPNADLTTLPMSDFIGQGSGCVIITVSDDADFTIPAPYLGNGFYYGCHTDSTPKSFRASADQGRRPQLYYTGVYSNSDDPHYVRDNQLAQLGAYRGGDETTPMLLSEWTITEQTSDQATHNIITDAASIQSLLYSDLPVKMQYNGFPTYPNLIGVDNFSSQVRDLAFKINTHQIPYDNTGKLCTYSNDTVEIESAFHGATDVTDELANELKQWQYNDRMTFNVYSTAPYKAAPPGVFKTNTGVNIPTGPSEPLNIVVRKYNLVDNCSSYSIQYCFAPGEDIQLDPRDMNLRTACAQIPKLSSNQSQAGKLNWSVVCATYGPIDRTAVERDASGNYVGGPLLPRNITNLDGFYDWDEATSTMSIPVNYQRLMQDPMGSPWKIGDDPVPYELRILLARYPANPTAEYNRANSTTYKLITAFDGDTVMLGPDPFDGLQKLIA